LCQNREFSVIDDGAFRREFTVWLGENNIGLQRAGVVTNLWHAQHFSAQLGRKVGVHLALPLHHYDIVT
jgi:hypothetical protein